MGTPPTITSTRTTAVASDRTYTSPSTESTAALPISPNSPSSPTSTSAGGSSTNRFGLALNFIQRRPRGVSNPNGKPGSPGSGGSSSAGGGLGGSSSFFGASGIGSGSPSSELPPSPSSGNGGERSYGFPALRRTLSKKPNSNSNGIPVSPPANSEGTSSSNRNRPSRSSSQPPRAPVGLVVAASTASRPHTSAGPSTPTATSSTNLPSSSSTTTTNTTTAVGATSTATDGSVSPSTTQHRLRLVPHLESARSLHFDPLDRDLPSFFVLRVGRFTDRTTATTVTSDPRRIAFKSKVVSRGHAEIWCDDSGKFFIKDTKSSSGTFLNHIRLSGPGIESRPFPLKDGDILQLGVDYQGGTEEIYRCVKMKVELNRGWQRGMNSFNTNALAQLRALGGGSATLDTGDNTIAVKTVAAKKAVDPNSVTDCCICLYPVTVCQALFIAPCSHVTHFKCIRPLVDANYPGFSCPLCRTYADLEADVEVEPWEMEPAPVIEEEEEVEAEAEVPIVDSPEVLVENGITTTSRPNSVRPSKRSSSRRSSVAHIEQLDSTTIPESLSLNSLRLVSIDLGTSQPLPLSLPPSSSVLPEPIPMGLSSISIFSAEQQASLYASLADAQTPPNSTFLSTLAGTIPSDQISTRLSSNGLAGPSVSKRGTPLTRVVSSDSEEGEEEGEGGDEETDGNSNNLEEEEGQQQQQQQVRGSNKGKGKWVAGQEIPMEDLLRDSVRSSSSSSSN